MNNVECACYEPGVNSHNVLNRKLIFAENCQIVSLNIKNKQKLNAKVKYRLGVLEWNVLKYD